MPNKLISIIIPCYNLAGYTRKCIESILNQTYTDIEVIAIDDGSMDETPEILSELAAKDSRVVFLRQENAGAGAACNRGIEIARGEFLAFVDNDDWVEPQMYERLHAAITENDADMAVCNFNLVYDDYVQRCYSDIKNEVVEVKRDVYGYFCRYCACPRPNNYTWTRLYRTKDVRNSGIRFEEFRLGADTLFNFKLLPWMRRVAFISDGLYNYVQRSNSSVYTMANKCNIASVYADGFEALADYYISNGYDDFCRVLPIHAFTRLRSVFFYSRLAGMKDEQILMNLKEGFGGRKIVEYLTGAIK